MGGFATVLRQRVMGALALFAPIAGVLATIGAAQAEDFCQRIDQLIVQSRSHFAEISSKPDGGTGAHDEPMAIAGASFCTLAKTLDGAIYHCGWEFPYRAERAYETFDEFVRGVDDCIGQRAALHSDHSVNHPDFYDLRRFELEQTDVSVSVKDKAALGRTIVFIRVQNRASAQ